MTPLRSIFDNSYPDCLNPDCSNPKFKKGPLCIEHGCQRCGGIILADTEDWDAPLCAECAPVSVFK